MKKGVKYPIEILERREVEALLAGCGTSPTGRRDRAVLTLLWQSGLQISEALALRPADVNLSHGTVRVLRGKGGKSRTVALDAFARSAARSMVRRPSGGTRSALLPHLEAGSAGQGDSPTEPFAKTRSARGR
jgi:integrase/recombinase XerD